MFPARWLLLLAAALVTVRAFTRIGVAEWTSTNAPETVRGLGSCVDAAPVTGNSATLLRFAVGADGAGVVHGKVFLLAYDVTTDSLMLEHTIDSAGYAGAAVSNRFGASCALTDDLLVVGAPEHGVAIVGAVYVFHRSSVSGSWVHIDTLVPDMTFYFGDPLVRFGQSVDLLEPSVDLLEPSLYLAVGAHMEDVSSNDGNDGIVYVYRWDEQSSEFVGSGTRAGTGSSFLPGLQVRLSAAYDAADPLVVGGTYGTNEGLNGPFAALLSDLQATPYETAAYPAAVAPTTGPVNQPPRCGRVTAVDPNQAVIASSCDGGGFQPGRVDLWQDTRRTGDWSHVTTLRSHLDATGIANFFGVASLDLRDDSLIVGGLAGGGHVELYHRRNATSPDWVFVADFDAAAADVDEGASAGRLLASHIAAVGAARDAAGVGAVRVYSLQCDPGTQFHRREYRCVACPSGTVRRTVGAGECQQCTWGTEPSSDATVCRLSLVMIVLISAAALVMLGTAAAGVQMYRRRGAASSSTTYRKTFLL